MSQDEAKQGLSGQSIVLDVIYQHRQTEAVFKDYERQTGRCICCQSLFDTLEQAAQAHGLDLAELLARLRAAIAAGPTK